MGRKNTLLDVSGLIGRTGGVEEFELDSARIEEVDFTASVRNVRIRVIGCGASVQVVGSFSATVPLECSRCLTGFGLEIAGQINESIPIRLAATLEGEDLEAADEYDVPLLHGSHLDVAELVRQQILLTLPMIPLCSEACEGLAPGAGEEAGGGSVEPETEFGRILANALKTVEEDEPAGEA